MIGQVLLFVMVGLVAQAVDGALGMAYGVTSTAVLLTMGVPPAAASASVHMAEVIATGASGLSHWKFGNVDRAVTKALLIPGMVGALLGVLVLKVVPGHVIKPFVSAYLLFVALALLYKALNRGPIKQLHTPLVPLGFVGAFCDAVGGGGWGAIITSTLIARGGTPRCVVGSSHAAKFFVSTVQAAAFLITVGVSNWNVVLGLLIGSLLLAPFGAILVRKLPPRAMATAIGVSVALLSAWNIVSTMVPMQALAYRP